MNSNEQVVRRAYEAAERVDLKAFVDCFTPDGTFTDMSINVTYRGPDGPLGIPATVTNYAKAFPDMHRELYKLWTLDDMVFVELALQGTHKGPLKMGEGFIPATGKRMDTPCFDAFKFVNGKISTFHCYPSGTVVLSQLGVFGNLDAVIQRGG
jgi:ketosteroid isomerase-like protein